MNVHTLPRTFFFTHHGQSEYNVLGKIGGNAGLSSVGTEYSKRLAIFVKEVIAKGGMIPGENIDNSGGERKWWRSAKR
jgi:broad specificity phosphatase PhoE